MGGIDEPNPVADGASEKDGEASIHKSSANWLFSTAVPHANNEEIPGHDRGFENTEEDSQGDESLEVF